MRVPGFGFLTGILGIFLLESAPFGRAIRLVTFKTASMLGNSQFEEVPFWDVLHSEYSWGLRA